MKNKVIKMLEIIFIFIIITTIFLSMINKCEAMVDVTQDPDFFKPTEEARADDRIGTILGIITIVGVFASVISLSIIGIKFMTGSVEQKADYKQVLLPWSIGAILLFSLTTIPSIIYNMTNGVNTVETVEISLDKTEVTLKIGEIEQVTLNATVMSGSSKPISWITSDNRVATVDSNGKVTAKSQGKAVIKAVSGQSEASCTITVEAVLTSNITISQDKLTLDAPITNSRTLTAAVTPYNSTEPVYWTSSDTSVATVSSTGEVIAKGAGTATITATSGTKSAKCTVQVNSERIYTTKDYDVDKDTVSSSKPSGKYLEFLIYIPEVSNVKNLSKLPLIVYMHGSRSMEYNPMGIETRNANCGAICIFPVSPKKEDNRFGWAEESDRITYLKNLIDYAIENYNVDSDKIALTGFSNGGSATWRIGLKYPKLFSCLVTVSGYRSYESSDDKYPDCPLWAIYSTEDEDSIYHAETMVDLLQDAGGQAKLDSRKEPEHGNMDDIAYTPELIDWMISRSRKTNSTFKFE